ncbi:MAG: pirin family protein [Pseudomonadota bacterium]
MITLRRASERHHERIPTRRRRSESWLSFAPELGAAPSADGFGALRRFTECRLPPGGSLEQPPQVATEVLTYVVEGSLAFEDSTGSSGVLHAGEFQQRTGGRSVRHRETNASRSDEVHFFQIWLQLQQSWREPGQQQNRFSVADRRKGLRIISSPDNRSGSLRLHLDALAYSALMEPGLHVVHELLPGRSAWLHVVHGELTFGDLVLVTGDGIGVVAEPSVSITAREETEVLLVDLGGDAAGPSQEEAA